MRNIHLDFFLCLMMVLSGCQKTATTPTARTTGEKSGAELDSKLSGVVYSDASLALTGTETPAAAATVNVYQLDTSTLSPTLLGTTTTDDAGAYSQYFTLGDATTLLVIALKNNTSIGQSIVAVPAASQGLALANQVRTMTGDVTRASTIAASLLLGKDTKLDQLTSTILGNIVKSVQTEIEGKSSSSIATLTSSLSSSTSFISSL